MTHLSKAAFIASILRGETAMLDQIPDPTEGALPEESLDETDEFAFLTQSDLGQERASFIDTMLDDRGYNILDLICEKAVKAHQENRDISYLAPVTLQLIVQKGAWVGEPTLDLLYEPHQRASFGRHLRRVHRFRRTIGLFSLAAFGFDALGQHSVRQSQGWATRRLYGIAHVIHDDLYSSNIEGSCAMLHPAFLQLLKDEPGIRHFARTMADDQVMMDSIRDNHAHRFLITLLKTPSFEKAVLRTAQNSGNTDEVIDLATRCVLLAEDMHEQRASLTQWFGKRNMRILEAQDGVQALEVFRQNHCDLDLILTDFGMPEMDGLNFAIKVRALDSQIPIIMQTTPPIHPDLRAECNRFGVCLIQKFDERLLEQRIREAVRLERV